MTQKDGRIITFYSYKGGTGRTMAVSNVAWVLASNGKDVLLIDWDLEAPGLHRYLRPFLIDPELAGTPGLIDFVWDAAQTSVSPVENEAPSPSTAFPSLLDYVVGLNWDFHGGGSISFIPAGRQDENYAQRVNTFSWDNFYDRLGGGKILHAERDRLRASYDYVLIDSRTGVSDTSSICTVQMPDCLAILFTLNRQSMRGAAAVARSIRAQRDDAFPIFPVPTRIENKEAVKFDRAINYARRTFAPFLLHVQSQKSEIDLDQQVSYWQDVETPYDTVYAFEEVPAAFNDEPGRYRTVLAANEHLASWITNRIVTSLQPDSTERRKEVVAAYAFTDDDDRELKLSPDKVIKRRFLRRLLNIFRPSGERLWRYAATVAAGIAIVAAMALGYTQSKLTAAETNLTTRQQQISEASAGLLRLSDRVEYLKPGFLPASAGNNAWRRQVIDVQRNFDAIKTDVNTLKTNLIQTP
jgi:MinD-like ATPase involved in chromosome partitioning or flagellar assembly